MKKITLYILTALATLTLSAHIANAADMSEIIDVKRNITLSDDEKVYKDYYISAPNGGGLRKNMVVKATRKVAVKNSSQKVVGQFSTVIGTMKIIHVEDNVAVAREISLKSRDEDPMLEQIGIMIGDKIDTTDSFIDNKKK